MTWKERILAAINGEYIDRLPFVPRMDIWYRFHKLAGTLPSKYRNATLMEISEDIDIGYHAVIPDFSEAGLGKKSIGFALGMPNISTLPYLVDFSRLEIKVKVNKGVTTIIINTPFGQVRTRTIYDDRMRRSGVTSPAVIEKAIKSVDDYKPVAYIFDHLGIEPVYKNFLEFEKSIGNRGIAVAWNHGAASPFHLIMMHLMPFELFVYEFNDNLKSLEEFAGKIKNYYNKVSRVVQESPAKVILTGANYDSFLTWFPFFKKYITPYLKKQSENIHARGKYLITHADGENSGLLEEYLNCEVDIADSICPHPMTSMSIKEIREVFDNKITIWGGLPSICTLKGSMTDYNFEKYLNKWFTDIDKGQKLIISFADTTPPYAELGRILKVARLAREFGPVESL